MGVYEGRIHQEPAAVTKNYSEEYFNFPERDKKFLASQKSTIKIYLGILNEHFWGKEQAVPTTNNSVMPLLLTSMMTVQTTPQMSPSKKIESPTDTKKDESK